MPVSAGSFSGNTSCLSRRNFWQTWCSWLKVWASSLGCFLFCVHVHWIKCLCEEHGGWELPSLAMGRSALLELPSLLLGGSVIFGEPQRRMSLFQILPTSVVIYYSREYLKIKLCYFFVYCLFACCRIASDTLIGD